MIPLIKVAVIGASGYTGGELLRILAQHPRVEVVMATSREFKGKPIHYVHFNLRGFYRHLRFTEFNLDKVSELADAVFLALPHGVSVNYVPKLLEVGLKVIDLSADFRLKDPKAYITWYGYEHPYPDLLKKAVYGLPELHRDELRNTNLIASPGCNATASILALLPLIKYSLIDTEFIVVDVKAGSSEGGSKPSSSSHHPEREGSVRPYSVGGHRHVAEVEQELSLVAGKEVKATLTPHAVSIVRGVLATAYARTIKELSDVEVLKAYARTYVNEPFIRIVHNSPPGNPNPKYVVGSNYADVGFALESRLGIVKGFTAIDNLMKGGAGQAVQAFNIMMGFNEGAGLSTPPLKPA